MMRLYFDLAMHVMGLLGAGACAGLTVYNALLYITERHKAALYLATGHAALTTLLILLHIGRLH